MWFIIGIIVGAAVLGLVYLARSKNISITWYEWLIGGVGLALLLYAIQNLAGSLWEGESTAAWMFLLFFGLPALILMVLAWQLVARRIRTA